MTKRWDHSPGGRGGSGKMTIGGGVGVGDLITWLLVSLGRWSFLRYCTMSCSVVVSVFSYYRHVLIAHRLLVEDCKDENSWIWWNRPAWDRRIIGWEDIEHQIYGKHTKYQIGKILDLLASLLRSIFGRNSSIWWWKGRFSRRQSEVHFDDSSNSITSLPAI